MGHRTCGRVIICIINCNLAACDRDVSTHRQSNSSCACIKTGTWCKTSEFCCGKCNVTSSGSRRRRWWQLSQWLAQDLTRAEQVQSLVRESWRPRHPRTQPVTNGQQTSHSRQHRRSTGRSLTVSMRIVAWAIRSRVLSPGGLDAWVTTRSVNCRRYR